jgi:hypothetical protein
MSATAITTLIGVAIVIGWAGLLLLIINAPKWYRERQDSKKGQGMAKKRSTWEIEYGVGPNPERYSGYNRTETARLIAESHDEAVALLKEYDPDFDLKDLITSKRGGLAYIVADKNT